VGTALSIVGRDRRPANEGESTAYFNGLADGQSARSLGIPPTAYLEVGMDDYARGFRAGFYREGTERFQGQPTDGTLEGRLQYEG
jgi:hypothetical protein